MILQINLPICSEGNRTDFYRVKCDSPKAPNPRPILMVQLAQLKTNRNIVIWLSGLASPKPKTPEAKSLCQRLMHHPL